MSSYVCTDPKGEILEKCGKFLKDYKAMLSFLFPIRQLLAAERTVARHSTMLGRARLVFPVALLTTQK